MSPEIIAYIQQLSAQGYPEVSIRSSLLASGWQPEVIDQAFAAYHATVPAVALSLANQPNLASAPVGEGTAPVATASSTADPKRRQRDMYIGLAIVAAVVVVLVIAVSLLIRAGSKHALKRNQATVSAESDVQAIAGAVGNYVTAHDGNLPQSVTAAGSRELELCGADCSQDSQQVSLSSVDATKVQLKSYIAGLRAPTGAVYLVPHASCLADGSGIGSASAGTQPTMVFLYTVPKGSGTTERCVSL